MLLVSRTWNENVVQRLVLSFVCARHVALSIESTHTVVATSKTIELPQATVTIEQVRYEPFSQILVTFLAISPPRPTPTQPTNECIY